MAYVMVDVEADGPIPGDYSMVCFGAVLVREGLDKTFYGRLRPVSDKWVPEALAVSGFSREATLAFDDPKGVMEAFAAWLKQSAKGRPLFVSDNNGFDWQFINWYFWHICRLVKRSGRGVWFVLARRSTQPTRSVRPVRPCRASGAPDRSRSCRSRPTPSRWGHGFRARRSAPHRRESLGCGSALQ